MFYPSDSTGITSSVDELVSPPAHPPVNQVDQSTTFGRPELGFLAPPPLRSCLYLLHTTTHFTPS